jgi:hypothetical protein
MAMNRALNILSDREGTVTFGFLAVDAYYFRIVGHLSSKLGIDCAAQLRNHLASGRALRLFVDVASGDGSSFAARSALMRSLLANRQHVDSVTILAIGTTVSRAQSMATLLGKPSVILESPGLFQTKLRDAAQSARPRVAPTSGTVRVARSVRPVRRSSRPRARTA